MKQTFFSLVMIFCCQPIFAQTFSLVKDIMPGTEGAFYQVQTDNPVDVNGTLFFIADDGVHGKELWKSDGTNAGTSMVKDILPDGGSGRLLSLVNMDGILYFLLDADGITNLWRSDGTEAGTSMVSDVAVGNSLAVINNHLYFAGADETHGTEAWVSDGTNAGTVLLKDINPGAASADVTGFEGMNGLVYFFANAGNGYSGLWKTDGTTAGTVLITNVLPSVYGNGFRDMESTNGALFFITSQPNAGGGDANLVYLWKSDGTAAGTTQVKLIATAKEFVYVRDFVVSGNTVYYTKLFNYYRGSYMRAELWASDGTNAGTKRVAFFDGPDDSFVTIDNLTDVNGTLFFYGGTDLGDGLWKSNGLLANTALVKDIEPAAISGLVNMQNINGTLYFVGYDVAHGGEIWKSDGSNAGTVLVQDVVPGPDSSAFREGYCCGGVPFGIIPFTLSDGKLFVVCKTAEYGAELWAAALDDCAAAGSRLYVNAANTSSGSGLSWACAIKELRDAVAVANSNPAITEIWVAKGTYKPTAGTDRTAAFIINRGNLAILGGFAGLETSASAANPVANPTILSGDIGTVDYPDDNSYHIVQIANVAASANGLNVDGFLFEKGHANDPATTTSQNAYGGAMIAYGNSAGANIVVSRSGFTSNHASSAGGALGLYGGGITFDSCVFVANTAAFGGAAAVYQCLPIFSACIFRQNTALAGSGGAVIAYYATPTFNGSVFEKNVASETGGGVAQYLSNAIYTQCVFSGNSAATGGGIFQQQCGSQITNSTFFGNTSGVAGGAVALIGTGASASSRNNIFWKNGRAGLVNVAGADIEYLPGSSTGNFNNNILQANTSVPADNGSTLSNNLRGTNPVFVNELLPDGPDGWPIGGTDGLALQSGSPAKNMGNNTYAAAFLSDIQGNPRVVCTTVDLGAYENQWCPLITKNNGGIATSEVSVTNPFRSSLLIRYTGAEKADVEISSLSGQKVWKGSAIQKGQTQVNTASWPSGLYQVTIRTAANKPIVLKIVKTQ